MLGRAGAGVPPPPPSPAPSGREGGAPQVKEAWGCEALLHHRTQSAIRATGWVKGGRRSRSLHLLLSYIQMTCYNFVLPAHGDFEGT